MPVEKVFTIGVYGSTENDFFSKLVNNKIDLFIDIRRRRAVRGSKYSFVNSKRLQQRLKELSIAYQHIIELAPTNSIREIQKQKDKSEGVIKSQRAELSTDFVNEYQKSVLDLFNLSGLLLNSDFKNIVLFCVEKEHLACHRSIVAKQINTDFGIIIQNL